MDKPRNGGQWTEARFRSFIVSALRSASRRWGPKNEVLKRARVKRGFYLCNNCKETIPTSIRVGGKRQRNVFADHIDPVVDPIKGFTTYDDFISRLFCEIDGLQVLCKECHDEKTKAEREVSKTRKKNIE